MLKETKIPLRSKCCVLSADFRSGQLLIEMLVALGILTVGFLSVTTLLSRALGLNRTITDNYTATYLATEGIEVTKNILDSNTMQGRGWNNGFATADYEVDSKSKSMGADVCNISGGCPLTFDSVTKTYGYSPLSPTVSATPFYRTVSVALGNSEITVNSRVSWISRGGGQFNVDLEAHFFNWR